MAPLTQCLVLTTLAAVAAFSPAGTVTQRPAAAPSSTAVFENFGLDFAEDMSETTAAQLLGEDRYKQWVATTSDNSFLNRQVSGTLGCMTYT